MGRLRDWLVGRYLPSWAVQTILEENRQLCSQAEELRREYRTLRAYTDGLEHALRHGIQVEVNVEGGGAYADRSTESTDG
mgnify:FL=1